MPKRFRSPITRQIRIIRQSLTAIDRSLGRLVALTNGVGRGAAPVRAPQRHKLNLSPKRRAELELQGAYMGHLRNLKPRQKARVKALRVEKGIRAAIAMAKKLSRG